MVWPRHPATTNRYMYMYVNSRHMRRVSFNVAPSSLCLLRGSKISVTFSLNDADAWALMDDSVWTGLMESALCPVPSVMADGCRVADEIIIKILIVRMPLLPDGWGFCCAQTKLGYGESETGKSYRPLIRCHAKAVGISAKLSTKVDIHSLIPWPLAP